MATVYKFSDPGVPPYSFSSSTSSVLHFNALKTVLKACLVSGYLGKSAAGWELVSEGSNWLTLRNGSHSGYLHFAYYPNGNDSRVDISLSSSFSGVISPPALVGDGVISGVAAAGTSPQRLVISQLALNSSFHAWTIIADERSFVLSWACASGSGNYTTAGNAGTVALYAGETSTGQFISLGGVGQSSTGGLKSRFDGAGVTLLKDPGTGLLVKSYASGTITVLSGLLDGTSLVLNPMPCPRQHLVPVNIFGAMGAGGTGDLIYMGDLRGCCVLPTYTGVFCANLLGLLKPGASGNYEGVMEALPSPFSDSGFDFYVRYNSASSCSGLITNHQDYWQ